MRKHIKSLAVIIAAFAIIFTSIPMLSGDLTAHAVSTPAKVKTFNAKTVSQTKVKLTWKKAGKCSGYAIYVNGKLNKRVSAKTLTYTVPKLKAGTTYKFTIKSYNTYKQTQYYNSKTKKWQTKKPAKKNWKKCPSGKYKGKKTRKVTAYKYSKVSAIKTAKTKAKPKTTTKPNDSTSSSNMTTDVNENSGSSDGSSSSGGSNSSDDTGNNGGNNNNTTPPPNLPSGANTTGGVYDQTQNHQYYEGSPKWNAIQWAKTNIPSNASTLQKIGLALQAVPELQIDGYYSCVYDANIIIYILDYVGVKNTGHNCTYAYDYGAPFNPNHVNNLIWINNTPYVIDASISGGQTAFSVWYYEDGHIVQNGTTFNF